MRITFVLGRAIIVTILGSSFVLHAAEPTTDHALTFEPLQADIDFERPTSNEISRCEIRSVAKGKSNAWVVYSPSGEVLRRFVDTNNDNKVDQWCYSKGGIEVYRDIDGDFDGKADQYRWFGTGGSKWGLDENEDGQIDAWKWISVEEVSAELIEALKSQDVRRFESLLISDAEIKSLGFGSAIAKKIKTQVSDAKKRFRAMAATLNLNKSSAWLDFSAPQPGVVPADGENFRSDIVVYENVIAIVSNDSSHGQINIGTMVKSGNAWRIIGLPESDTSGFFFTAANHQHMGATGVSPKEVDSRMQGLVDQLSILDSKLSKAHTATDITNLNKDRATILRDLAKISTGSDKELWQMQLVDAINVATQTGNYPAGQRELKELYEQISSTSKNQEVVAQVRFAYLSAEYAASLLQKDADYSKIQEKWLNDLSGFVSQFPRVPQAAEAMLQLAIAEEFAGNHRKANEWYTSIAEDFPGSDLAKKAAGARRRLESVGKSIRLSGKTLDRRSFDLNKKRGQYVLIHYWATWSESSIQDIKTIRQLEKRFRNKGFTVVGVNLDNATETAESLIRNERISWPQLYDSRGLEGAFATDMGIFTLPVMILVDKNGTVINRSVSANELEAILANRIR